MVGGSIGTGNWLLTGDPAVPGGAATEHGYVRFAKTAYSERIRLLSQQLENRLAGIFDVEPLMGAPRIIRQVKEVGRAALNTNRVRNQTLVYKAVPTEYRTLLPNFFDYPSLYDPRDRGALLQDVRPGGELERAVIAAFMQEWELAIVTAFDANVSINDLDDAKDAASSTTFANDNGSTIVHRFTEAEEGTAAASATILQRGLNTSKLVESRRILEENAAINPGARLVCAAHPRQIYQLIRDAKAQSLDFNVMAPLASGTVVEWMGMTIIPTLQIASEGTDGANDPFGGAAIPPNEAGDGKTGRYAFVATSDAVAVGADPVTTEFDKVPERGNSLQVLHKAAYGAVRLDGKKVVRIECMDAD